MIVLFYKENESGHTLYGYASIIAGFNLEWGKEYVPSTEVFHKLEVAGPFKYYNRPAFYDGIDLKYTFGYKAIFERKFYLSMHL